MSETLAGVPVNAVLVVVLGYLDMYKKVHSVG